MPGYTVSQNELEPNEIVNKYVAYLSRLGMDPQAAKVLEIGVGATNSTGYELSARIELDHWFGFDPFRPLNGKLDRYMLDRIACRYAIAVSDLKRRVLRIDQLDDLAPGSIDLILSHCVIEHVKAPGKMIANLATFLRPGGRMIHAVDYRDHYFRYPFHFLKFSEKTWQKWLNPGDLPRYRLLDHVKIFRNLGLKVEVFETLHDPEAFARIEPWVQPTFKRGTPDDAAVWAVMVLSTASTEER